MERPRPQAEAPDPDPDPQASPDPAAASPTGWHVVRALVRAGDGWADVDAWVYTAPAD